MGEGRKPGRRDLNQQREWTPRQVLIGNILRDKVQDEDYNISVTEIVKAQFLPKYEYLLKKPKEPLFSRPTVYSHLKVLIEEGTIRQEKDGLVIDKAEFNRRYGIFLKVDWDGTHYAVINKQMAKLELVCCKIASEFEKIKERGGNVPKSFDIQVYLTPEFIRDVEYIEIEKEALRRVVEYYTMTEQLERLSRRQAERERKVLEKRGQTTEEWVASMNDKELWETQRWLKDMNRKQEFPETTELVFREMKKRNLIK